MITTITITRYRLANCGASGYRPGPAWHWAYDVHVPGHQYKHGMGRGLRSARDFAAQHGARVVENWPGGKTWIKGPRGGLRAEAS